jgi:hypothetical protein
VLVALPYFKKFVEFDDADYTFKRSYPASTSSFGTGVEITDASLYGCK